METTLHRQLKDLYADDASQQEVTVDGYRIDAIDDHRLIEIQFGSLAAIRPKIRRLLQSHEVLIVKPLAGRRYLITREKKNGSIRSSRYSPLRGSFYDLFEEFVHFVDVFPHPRLTLELLLTELEEHRLPARRRRWWNKRYRVQDRKLRGIEERLELRSPQDLAAMLPISLPVPFTTEDIAREADIPRWLAQKLGYCLRKMGAAHTVGKRGNALLYQLETVEQKAA